MQPLLCELTPMFSTIRPIIPHGAQLSPFLLPSFADPLLILRVRGLWETVTERISIYNISIDIWHVENEI